jgi:hypothetical protein
MRDQSEGHPQRFTSRILVGTTIGVTVQGFCGGQLFGFFLRRVSKEQSSVENLSREFASMEREQRLKETAALKELKKSSGQ